MITTVQWQGKKYTMGRRQANVLSLLLSGRKISVTDIVRNLGYSDPRGHISSLRRKGIPIMDEWVTTREARFKRYFIYL